MKFKALSIATALLGLGAAPALANTNIITIDALPYSGDVPGGGASADYVAAWDAALAAHPTPPSGYYFQTVPVWNNVHNSGVGGSSGDLIYNDSVTFTVSSADEGTWSFKLGIDFGWGGTLIMNGPGLGTGAVLMTSNNNLWWAGNINDANNTLFGTVDLTIPGTYTLNVYGAEDCCDGGTTGQFLAPGAATYQTFSAGEPAVPESSTWAMMLLGFFGLGFAGYRRASATRIA
ncbi:CCXG family PEP-CTERM protein [Rhodoblastus sp.]|uniref:CCXG family PEP-CTERM protein n=1 Tax=Rhodoblastus sp. TaxID=1962975 RepID=UPI003F97970B